MKFLTLILSFSLFSPQLFASTTLWGEEVSVGQGMARSYVEVDDANEPLSLGISLTGGVLNGLPDQMHQYDYMLPLPKIVCLPPYKYAMLNWNPHGHDPVEIYGKPHFDFHFYTIPNDVREKITCTGDDEATCMKMPSSDYIPAYYSPTPAGVPMMGWHWFDTRSGEFHGQPFTSTLIYGFYDGKVAFVEPMITREFLQSHGTVDADIPAPAKVADDGYYPQHYNLDYDSVQDRFMIRLDHFTYKSAESGKTARQYHPAP